MSGAARGSALRREGAALALIVRRSLRQHLPSTLITAVSIALAGGLLMGVWSLERQGTAAFTGGASGFDAVVGVRGSQLQIVLNAIFHVESSPGNLPWTLYEDLRRDPRVEQAVPYALGDNYVGFRVVGTTAELFTRASERGQALPLASGRLFGSANEAVLGSTAARQTHLRVGDLFHPAHGIGPERSRPAAAAVHPEGCVVTGILRPSGSPLDRLIFMPIESVLSLSGHVLRGGGREYRAEPGTEIPIAAKEVSAILLCLRGPQAGFTLDEEINRRGQAATFAWPVSRIMADLFQKLAWAGQVFALIAVLVVAVAAGSVLASLYNAINERRRDLAILRALGARRRTLFAAVILESAAIAALGSVGAFGVYAVLLGAGAGIIRAQTGVVVEVFHFHPVLVVTPPAMILLGALAGIWPAVRAYATDVLANLNPNS